jgi:hypothetical protein
MLMIVGHCLKEPNGQRTHAAWFNSMRHRCQSGLRDLHVVLRRIEARAADAVDSRRKLRADQKLDEPRLV